MYLGDNLLQGGIVELVERFRAGAADALILLTPVPDPRTTASPSSRAIASCASSRSRRSRAATSRWSASTCSRRRIHDAARAIEPSARGELEITDAIQHLVDTRPARRAAHRQRLVEGHRPARGHARGQPPDPRHARGALRRRARSTRSSTGASSSRRARGSSARPCAARRSSAPARGSIDAYVGPYTAVGEDCVIESAEVEHSILLAGLRGPRPRRPHRVLAARTQRRGSAATTRQPRAYRFMLGDNSEVRDPVMRVLVTGAGGMLGRDVVAAAARAATTCVGLTHARARHHRRAARSPRRSRAARRTRSSTAPPGPTSTAPRRDEARRFAVNADGAGNLARAARRAPGRDSCTSRPTTSSTGTASAAVRRVRPDRCRRPPTGAPSSPASAPCWRPRRGTPWCAPRGCSGVGGRNFVTTMLAKADAGRARDRGRHRPGRLPDLHRASRVAAARPRGAASAAASSRGRGRRLVLVNEFAQAIFAAAGLECECVPRRPAPSCARAAQRPAWSVLGTERDERAAAAWRDGPRRLPRARSQRRAVHEAARLRRRRLHRLELRAPARCAAATTRSWCSTSSPTPGAARTSHDLEDDPRFSFVHGAIEDRRRGGGGDRRRRRGRQLRRRDARRPLDRGARRVRAHPRARHLRAARGGARARHPLPAGLDRRGLRLDRRGLVHRELAAATRPRPTARRRPAPTCCVGSYHDTFGLQTR